MPSSINAGYATDIAVNTQSYYQNITKQCTLFVDGGLHWYEKVRALKELEESVVNRLNEPHQIELSREEKRSTGKCHCGVTDWLVCAAKIQPCLNQCAQSTQACLECLGSFWGQCCPCVNSFPGVHVHCDCT